MATLLTDDLLANSELAGLARVIAVRHTPVGPVARIRFEQLVKGRFRGSLGARSWSRLSGTAVVRLRRARRAETGEMLQGEWSDRVDPGDRIMIHLCWDSDAGAYRTVSSNAIWLAPG